MVRPFAPSSICIVCESFYPVVGGMERQTYVLAKGLAKRGFKTVVLTVRNPSSLLPYEQLEHFPVYRVAPGANRWLAMIPVHRALIRLQGKYDLICVCGFRTLGVPAILVGNHLGKRVVLRAENIGELSGAYFDAGLSRFNLKHSSPVVRQLNRVRQSMLRRCDRFIAISSPVEREFYHQGVVREKLSLIPNSVDLQCFRPASSSDARQLRDRLRLPQNSFIVCFSGRIVKSKGVLELLEAWKSVLRWIKTSPRILSLRPLLLIVGEGGGDTGSCEVEARCFCREHVLGDSVFFTGGVENVEDYLRASDIYVLPTREESFGLSVLEAMACGLAVVSTSVGGLADYVRHGENALVIAPGVAEQIADAICQLIHDPSLRNVLGENARHVARRFSQERFVDKHVDLFFKLLAAPFG